MLELVEVDLTLGERGVRLLVGAEVDELDRDALVSGCFDERSPLRVSLADDPDLDGLVLGVTAACAGVG